MGRRYTEEEKEKAIKLYEKLGHITWVMAELGYPTSRTLLYAWIKDYKENGTCSNKKRSKYTEEQRQRAVEYFKSHGMSVDEAVLVLGEDEHPIIHSDRGCHYRWPGWIERMDRFHLIRSMSKKACSPDNSACEGFFGRLKNEMFYGRSWAGVSLEDFICAIDDYIHWYNERRIKKSLGYLSPAEYRMKMLT